MPVQHFEEVYTIPDISFNDRSMYSITVIHITGPVQNFPAQMSAFPSGFLNWCSKVRCLTYVHVDKAIYEEIDDICNKTVEPNVHYTFHAGHFLGAKLISEFCGLVHFLRQ